MMLQGGSQHEGTCFGTKRYSGKSKVLFHAIDVKQETKASLSSSLMPI
jgi:hypothetical protein